MDILQEIAENVRYGETSRVSELVQKGLDDGLSWEVLLSKGLFKGMEVVGELMREEEC